MAPISLVDVEDFGGYWRKIRIERLSLNALVEEGANIFLSSVYIKRLFAFTRLFKKEESWQKELTSVQ